MWTREELKTRAKAVLKVSYWKAFLVSIIFAFAGGVNTNFNWNFGNEKSDNIKHGFSQSFYSHEFNELSWLIPILIIIAIFVFLVVFAFYVFLANPLQVGCRSYFIKSAQYNADLNQIGFSFNKGRYLNIVKTMFIKGFYNFLWFMLLIIPGIIKYFSYFMVPYILADNPNIGYKRAIELSKRMTYGHKFKIFVLELSFIGWFLLGVLALAIGVLFVMPYPNATNAELYLTLREIALNKGLCSYEELNIEHNDFETEY